MPEGSGPGVRAAAAMGWTDEQIDEFKQAFYSFDQDGEASVPPPLPPSPMHLTVWRCAPV